MKMTTSSTMPLRRARRSGVSVALLVTVCVALLSSLLLDVGFAEAPSKMKRKSFKPMRDPAKPKRPASPWLQFAVKFRAENPGLGKDALKKASAAWKTVDEATKRGFEEKYEAARGKYKEELAAYKSSGKEEAWLRPAGKPKQPMTPFLLYGLELWKQGGAPAEPSGFSFSNPFGGEDSADSSAGSISVTENMKRAASKWKDMSESEKAPYEAQYQKAKAEYQAAMEKFKASGAQQEWEKKVGILKQKEKMAAKVARAKAKAKAEAKAKSKSKAKKA